MTWFHIAPLERTPPDDWKTNNGLMSKKTLLCRGRRHGNNAGNERGSKHNNNTFDSDSTTPPPRKTSIRETKNVSCVYLLLKTRLMGQRARVLSGTVLVCRSSGSALTAFHRHRTGRLQRARVRIIIAWVGRVSIRQVRDGEGRSVVENSKATAGLQLFITVESTGCRNRNMKTAYWRTIRIQVREL